MSSYQNLNIAEAKVDNHVKVAKERSIFQTPREEDFSFSYCFFFFLSSCAVTLNESRRIICWKIVHRVGLSVDRVGFGDGVSTGLAFRWIKMGFGDGVSTSRPFGGQRWVSVTVCPQDRPFGGQRWVSVTVCPQDRPLGGQRWVSVRVCPQDWPSGGQSGFQ